MIRRALVLFGALLLGGGSASAQSGQPFAGSCLTIGTTQICGSGTTITGLASLGITAPVVNTVPLTVSGYSLTGSNASSLLSLAGTWNTSGTPTGLFLNITDTASNAASLLADFQIGGTGKFSVKKSGSVLAGDAAGGGTLGYAFQSDSTSGLFRNTSDGQVGFGQGGLKLFSWSYSNGISIDSTMPLGWSSGAPGTSDTRFFRDAAGIIAQRNANNGQILRVGYNWTDASNYSWGLIDAGQTTANTISLGSRSVGAPAQKLTKLRIEADGTLIEDYAVTTASTLTLAPAVALGTLATDATHTDATVCRDTTSGLLLAGSGAVGICLGTSSMRFKHDIAPAVDGLAAVMALKPVTYRYNPGHVDGGKTVKYGFLAEDVVGVLPKLVGLDLIGRPNSVDMIGFVPILARAIQELKTEVDQLRATQRGRI